MKITALLPSVVLSLIAGALASAAVKTEVVEYKDGDTVLEGFVAYDDARTGARPGVLVIHDWTGLQDYAKKRATMLAELVSLRTKLGMPASSRTDL